MLGNGQQYWFSGKLFVEISKIPMQTTIAETFEPIRFAQFKKSWQTMTRYVDQLSSIFSFLRVMSLKQEEVVFEDNTQCQFNLKNYKILYIVNSENCFYRRLALRRAAEVRRL